jgi:peptidoglycan/xylan/chitin deacetylase (PgdA/CDA1 family)
MNKFLRYILLPCFGTAFAGPVTTVPWNGHTGAVSFTYDDARSSQIPNLLPQLDSLHLKATFFIAVTGTGGDFEARKADWIKVAKNGHELANHTKNHVNVPADPGAASIIAEMATYLRALDPGVQSLTFAYPNCNVNGKTGVGSENFMARGCGGTRYAWGTQPADWMNIEGLILGPTSVASGISAISSAKSGNTWAVTIVHDVKENPDTYSLTPADNRKMLEAGAASGAWIDTYQNIGAYYRAHFTMDTVTATSTSEGWKMAWTSPYAKLPKSVSLRVKLAAANFGTSFTVQQNGVTLPPETDGAYLIDFMKLSLTVLKQTTGVKSGAIFPVRLIARAARDGIAFDGMIGEADARVYDVRGNRIFQGRVSQGLVPLPMAQVHGILFLTLVDRVSGAAIRAVVPN